jgi:hypothetical protein
MQHDKSLNIILYNIIIVDTPFPFRGEVDFYFIGIQKF